MSSAAIATQTTFERWTADPGRTTVEFEVGHLWGLHTVRGRFRSFSGAYVVGSGGSAMELTIDAGSVDTGCVARDKHLRSADFFDAEEHPQVRFTSTRVTGLGSGRAHVSGELEAAGKRVPLAFDTSVRLIDGDLELEATTTVDPSRFGMSDGPLRNVHRPTTLRVKTRLVRVPSGFDGGRGGSGRVVRRSELAATRETLRDRRRLPGRASHGSRERRLRLPVGRRAPRVDEAAAWPPDGSEVAAAPATIDPITTNKGDEMSSALAERETTVERWTADPGRTTIEFEVEHRWGLHTVRGRFRSFSGAYVVGSGGSAIELTIDAGSVDTGCVARDKHLRSADFFDAEEHPQVRFTSTRVTGLGSGYVRLTGELEAAGSRMPLAFDASVRLVDGDLELEATTTVDQSRFGMSDEPLSNVRRPTTLRVKTRLVRVPSGFDGGRGGSGRVAGGSGLAAARETV